MLKNMLYLVHFHIRAQHHSYSNIIKRYSGKSTKLKCSQEIS